MMSEDPAGRDPGEVYRERHGDEPGDDASARHCEIRIDGLPPGLPPGEHQVTFAGMEYQPGDTRPVLRFRYTGRADEQVPEEQVRALSRQQAEDEGWLPAPAEVYRTKSGKIITEAMIEEWAAEAERGYDWSEANRWPRIPPPDLYQVSTTETLNISRLARVIAALLARGVIGESDLGAPVPVSMDPERAAADIEGWLRS
jgi:hypothetical protein